MRSTLAPRRLIQVHDPPQRCRGARRSPARPPVAQSIQGQTPTRPTADSRPVAERRARPSAAAPRMHTSARSSPSMSPMRSVPWYSRRAARRVRPCRRALAAPAREEDARPPERRGCALRRDHDGAARRLRAQEIRVIVSPRRHGKRPPRRRTPSHPGSPDRCRSATDRAVRWNRRHDFRIGFDTRPRIRTRTCRSAHRHRNSGTRGSPRSRRLRHTARASRLVRTPRGRCTGIPRRSTA
jgi:hypothetical protein